MPNTARSVSCRARIPPAADPFALRLFEKALFQPFDDGRGGARAAPPWRGNTIPSIPLACLCPMIRGSRPPKGPGATGSRDLERGYGLVLARTAWCDDRDHEGANRLDPIVVWEPFDQLRARPWRSCRFAAGHKASMLSISSGFWVVGCAA